MNSQIKFHRVESPKKEQLSQTFFSGPIFEVENGVVLPKLKKRTQHNQNSSKKNYIESNITQLSLMSLFSPNSDKASRTLYSSNNWKNLVDDKIYNLKVEFIPANQSIEI
jgi:hypothetical protein